MLNIFARAMMTASRCELLKEKDDQVIRSHILCSKRSAQSDPRKHHGLRKRVMMTKLSKILFLHRGSE